jgi:2,4-dienoyl-CoA reductase-like NADH-dependent reductase (Old Yellow Enzyme family)
VTSESPPRPLLFEPLAIRGFVARDRMMVSPMQQYASHDGTANDHNLVHLGRFAMGGAGMMIAEATAIEPIGRMANSDLDLQAPDADIVAIGRELLVDPNWTFRAERALRRERYDDWPREAGWWLDKRIAAIRELDEEGETPMTRHTQGVV